MSVEVFSPVTLHVQYMLAVVSKPRQLQVSRILDCQAVINSTVFIVLSLEKKLLVVLHFAFVSAFKSVTCVNLCATLQ